LKQKSPELASAGGFSAAIRPDSAGRPLAGRVCGDGGKFKRLSAGGFTFFDFGPLAAAPSGYSRAPRRSLVSSPKFAKLVGNCFTLPR